MPSPRSRGPNTCPFGVPGVDEFGSPPRWICATDALVHAFRLKEIIAKDWVEGTYPPDFESILAFEA